MSLGKPWRRGNVAKEYGTSDTLTMSRVNRLVALSFALREGVQVYEFPADWDNLGVPGAVIKTNRSGKQYNAVAGHARNTAMANFADALIAFHDGSSRGTANMIQTMKRLGKEVHVITY